MELLRKHPNLNLTVLIVSVQNRRRIHNIFQKYRPEVIFHAAAHKHVPLMENSPCDAIRNNVFGTMNVAREASACGTKRMVLISTDKAVRPTNIMGASKRICELVIQYANQHSDTEYMAVRFGNVLGSNGSVIPLFRKQIQEGGPVTVTHPDIIRYFMTIPEAVAYGKILSEVLDNIPNASPRLRKIANKCIDPDPKRRYSSFSELYLAIERRSSSQLYVWLIAFICAMVGLLVWLTLGN